MKRCDENIAKLYQENIQKDAEIVRKKKIHAILVEKSKRIEKQRSAVQKYQDFLEDVRSNNSDQYGSITAIIDRHKTLQELGEKLSSELSRKENALNTKRSELVKYENQMNTQTMQLNNEIANLKKSCEEYDDEKNRLKSLQQENSSQAMEKITQLSRILMAIDHLEGFCKYKKLQFNRSDPTTGLNYDAQNMQNEIVRKQYSQISDNAFDSYSDRTEYALSQIYIIGQYLNDFQKIRDHFLEGEKKGKAKVAKESGDKPTKQELAVIPEGGEEGAAPIQE